MYVSELELENKSLKNKINNCDAAYKTNKYLLDSVIEVNRKWNNHVVRMQYIAGIKNPDTIFKWIEKVKYPINTKRVLKTK